MLHNIERPLEFRYLSYEDGNKASQHPLSTRAFTISTIYEAYPRTEKVYVGGGLGLAPNGVSVLSSLGLDKQVKERTGVARISRFWSEGGTELASWDHNGFGEYMYGMMRSTLYDVLSDELSQIGLKIEYEKRAVKVEERGDKVFVEFQDGSTAEGDYLVAADGNGFGSGADFRCEIGGSNPNLPRLSETRVHRSQRRWWIYQTRRHPAQ